MILKDMIGDFGKKEYVGAFLDLGSGVGGAVAGNLATRFIGSAIMVAFIPEAAIGATGFAAGVGLGIIIDKISNSVKNCYYRRE